MSSETDWTDGPAKWIAVGLLSAAAIGGMSWTIAQKYPSRPRTVIIQPPDPPASAAADANPAPALHATVELQDPPPGPAQPPPSTIVEAIAREPSVIAIQGPETRPPRKAPAADPSQGPSAEPPADPPGDSPEPASPPETPPSEPATQEPPPPQPAPRPSTPSPQPPQDPAPTYAHIININTATAAELELLPGIGPALAGRIVDHRRASGPFRTIDDITSVRGIGPKTLEKLRPRIRIN